MRVFITGVAGFLGSHLADLFLREGHSVAGNDSLLGGSIENVPSGVMFAEIDCRNLHQHTELLAGADVVYHCAATAYEVLSVFSPALVTSNIVQASVSTMSGAIQAKVKRFVYCSSMARYGDVRAPFREYMRCRPQDPYGIGKITGELMLRNLGDTHGMEWVIAVPHNIYGPRQKYDDPYRNVASIMANRMLQGQQPIIYGDGMQKRCFSYIADDLPVLRKLATEYSVNGEVINIGPDEEFVTINELAERLAEIIGFNLDPIYVPDRPQEVKEANCSADKARRMLGYKTTCTLQYGLTRLVEDIERRGPKPFKYHLPVEIVNERTPETWTKRLI
jgi:UDP-glucose 4-epimerase